VGDPGEALGGGAHVVEAQDHARDRTEQGVRLTK
jgi:hypothetical protein